jgi:hypothetical protein
MRKICYWSDIDKEKKPVKNPPIGLVGEEFATENSGRNALTTLTPAFEPLIHGGSESTDYKENVPFEEDDRDSDVSKEVIDLLVSLGDEMDIAGEEHLANFADFLLKKYAEAETRSPEQSFNDLMIKVNNSDLTDTNETIKKLTKIFSRTVILEYSSHNDLNKAKNSAYKKVLHRADQYLSEG